MVEISPQISGSARLYRRVLLPTGPGRSAGASAILVRDRRIAWIGPDDDAPHEQADAGSVDLAGALVLPAFVDAHVHVTETGLLLDGVDLSATRSVTEILDLVAAAAAVHQPGGDGRQVLGHGWDELQLVEGRAPTAAELERAAAGAEVYLSRVDVHSAVVSYPLAERSGAVGVAGWDASGRVERDAHHAARHTTRFALSSARRRELQLLALRSAAAAGIGELHEMSAPHVAPEADLVSLLALVRAAAGSDESRAAGAVLPSVVPYRGELAGDEADVRRILADLAAAGLGASGLAGLAGDLMIDGSIGSRTAALTDDYTDAPGHRGHLYLDADQIRDHVIACTRTGLQAGFHVIGDGAVEALLAGFSAAADIVGLPALRAARHRIEHLESLDADGVDTVARFGLTASVQPAFDAAWGGTDRMYAIRLGAARAGGLNPFAAMAAAGIALAFGSDSPVTPFAPWEGIRAALLHRTARHRIPLGIALRAHTAGGRLAGSAPISAAPATARSADEFAQGPGNRLGYGLGDGPSPGLGHRQGDGPGYGLGDGLGHGPGDRIGDGELRVGDPATFTAWRSPALTGAGADPLAALAALAEELTGGDRVPECVLTLIDGRPAFIGSR